MLNSTKFNFRISELTQFKNSVIMDLEFNKNEDKMKILLFEMTSRRRYMKTRSIAWREKPAVDLFDCFDNQMLDI